MEQVIQKKVKFNKKFYKLIEILQKVIRGEPLTIAEMNFVGSRWSGKTYQILLFFGILMTLPKDIKVFILRNLFKDITRTFKEMRQILDKLGLTYEVWENKMIRIGNSEIQFEPLHTMKRDGKKMTGEADLSMYDYVFSFREEITEMESDDVEYSNEAIRGVKNNRFMTISASNPWSPEHWYIRYFSKYLSFNKERQKKGEVVELLVGDKYFHISTWRLNRKFLSWQKLKAIKDLEERNPIRAEVVSYGLPGIEIGAIYADYMKDIKPVTWQPTEFAAGVDFGIKRDKSTIDLVGRAPVNNGWKIGVLEEWGHQNEEGRTFFDSHVIARHMVDQVQYWFNKYYLQYLTIYVDNAAPTFIEVLERELYVKGLSDKVDVRPCIKTKIELRIDQVRGYMSLGHFYINTHCVETMKEFRHIVWDPNSKVPKRIDKNDHYINNVEYAIQPWLGDTNALGMYGLEN